MPRTLVTGATGFIGQRLVERLVEQGHDVACLVRATSRVEPLEKLGVERVVGSLSDDASFAAALRGVEIVYHLAGLTQATRKEDFQRVNAGGTKALCRIAAGTGTAPTVVLVSSLAAAGPSPPGVPHTESTPPAPISHYGKSKLGAEYAARVHADKLPLSIVRPPAVFGPGDNAGVLLFKSLRNFPVHFVPQMKGLPLSLIYVDDLVESLIAVGERGERVVYTEDQAAMNDPTGLYYAADPAESSYGQMGRMAGAAMDRRVWVFCRRKYPFLPLALGSDLLGRLRGKAPVFGMDKLREACASGWVCDPAKIATGLGWQPKTPLAERYQQTHDWYVENGWL